MKKNQKIYRYTLRLPENIHTMLLERASMNSRTMNTEILEIIRDALSKKNSLPITTPSKNDDTMISISGEEFMKAIQMIKNNKEAE